MTAENGRGPAPTSVSRLIRRRVYPRQVQQIAPAPYPRRARRNRHSWNQWVVRRPKREDGTQPDDLVFALRWMAMRAFERGPAGTELWRESERTGIGGARYISEYLWTRNNN